jgi:DNA repair protein RecN (Recombination protein N)
MLTLLRISGFAIVDQLEVRFGPGLNVLTGETGAGKSLLVEALHLVLGGRMSADVLRDGADEAVVEALFELPGSHPVFERLEAAGVTNPAGPLTAGHNPAGPGTTELLVRRVAARGGKGRAFVNGALCTVGMLEQALRGVVDVTGQHEHVALLDPATHLGQLDAFAGVDPSPPEREALLARYREAFGALGALVRERDGLALDAGERARRADYLAFQLKELDAVDPAPGEDAALEGERRVLASAERLREAARAAEGHVQAEDGSAGERLGQALRALADAAQLDPRLEGPVALLRSAAAEVDEAGRELSRYADGLGGDPERLQAVHDRLDALRAIARKHGGSLEAAVAARARMAAELAGLDGGGERLEALAVEIEAAGRRAAGLAAELTKARGAAAKRFAAGVAAELDALAMARCRLEVAFLPPEGAIEAAGARLGASGAERAELLIAPNPGESPRPLARIASGGELSRVLLAVKRVLARRDPVSTYVFDEVDSGVGGAVAEAMGRTLADVARGRQVLCVTHLPQVAAFADRHLRVEKRVVDRRTSAGVVPLEEAERRAELARMLAGATVTASALDHAASLLEAARAAPARPSTGRRAAPGRAAAREVAVRGAKGQTLTLTPE